MCKLKIIWFKPDCHYKMRSIHPGQRQATTQLRFEEETLPLCQIDLTYKLTISILWSLADPMLTAPLNQPPVIFSFYRRWEASPWSPPPCWLVTRAPAPSSCGSSCWSSSRTSPASSSSPGPGTAGSSNSQTRMRLGSVSIPTVPPLSQNQNILAQQIRECAIYKCHHQLKLKQNKIKSFLFFSPFNLKYFFLHI